MNVDKELIPDPNTKYLDPSMKFNLGTLKYEPVIPRKLSNQRLEKGTKLKAWLLGIILILILIFYASLFF